jgi:hypothetical protein
MMRMLIAATTTFATLRTFRGPWRIGVDERRHYHVWMIAHRFVGIRNGCICTETQKSMVGHVDITIYSEAQKSLYVSQYVLKSYVIMALVPVWGT